MLLRAALIAFCATVPAVVAAQGAPSPADLRAGHQLFTQSCAICHLTPQINSPRFGPLLSHQIVAGQEAAVRTFIQSGTPDMPGFRYELAPAQIDLIIAYLTTIPDPAQPDPGRHGQPMAAHAPPNLAIPPQGGMR